MPEGQAESLPDESGADMLAGVNDAPVVEAAPAPEPVADAPADTSQAFDYAAFSEQVGTLGDGYTPETILQKHRDAIKGMNEAQRERAEIARRYENFDPVVKKIQEDAGYAEALQRTTEEYFNKDSYQGVTDVPEDINQALNPLYQKIANMEVKLADKDIESKIAALKSDGMPIDEAVEAAIWKRIADTGSNDVNSHFWTVMGPTMVANVAKSTQQTTVETIQKNNSQYVETPTLPSVETKEVNIADLSERERGDMMEAELATMMPGG